MIQVHLQFPDGQIVPAVLPAIPPLGSLMEQSGKTYRVILARFRSESPGDDWTILLELILVNSVGTSPKTC